MDYKVNRIILMYHMYRAFLTIVYICPRNAATIRQQQTGIFERTYLSLLRRCQLCIAVGGSTFERLFQIGKKYNFFFSEYFSGFASSPTSVRPNMTVRNAARTYLRHTVP